MKTYFIFAIALCAFASCATAPGVAAPGEPASGGVIAPGELSASLTDTRWVLREIGGKAVPAPGEQSGREPFFVLSGTDKSFSGNGGVNIIRGNYELKGNSGLAISPLMRTMMAGPSLDREDELLHALQGVTSYSIRGNELLLSGTGSALRFVAGE